LDFGTESVRALLVTLAGEELASVVVKYRHGQILSALPGGTAALPPHYALQHPSDWMESASKAVRGALRRAGLGAGEVVGIGVDFTSCTMLPALRDGSPLCLLERFAQEPLAWPKLWKHHGAQAQADRINAMARERGEAFLKRYGGAIGLEWFFPKMLETLENAPPEPALALQLAGANPAAAFFYGTLPNVIAQFVAYTLYRWEINIRMAAILGVVGAGGLGQMLYMSLSLFQQAQAMTIILAMLLLVVIVDAASAALRARME
jgi:hypothetical protein